MTTVKQANEKLRYELQQTQEKLRVVSG